MLKLKFKIKSLFRERLYCGWRIVQSTCELLVSDYYSISVALVNKRHFCYDTNLLELWILGPGLTAVYRM